MKTEFETTPSHGYRVGQTIEIPLKRTFWERMAYRIRNRTLKVLPMIPRQGFVTHYSNDTVTIKADEYGNWRVSED